MQIDYASHDGLASARGEGFQTIDLSAPGPTPRSCQLLASWPWETSSCSTTWASARLCSCRRSPTTDRPCWDGQPRELLRRAQAAADALEPDAC